MGIPDSLTNVGAAYAIPHVLRASLGGEQY